MGSFQHRSGIRGGVLAVLALAAAVSVTAVRAEPAAIVGDVSLVIGVAKLIRADGTQQAIERGVPVRAGDRIETQAGGHVHVRFVDGGRVSVRPGSRLLVENYSHVANEPEASAIRFRLDEGAVRSITGNWGEASRDRFRLNTPVAAIGIKGTDFVVRSDADNTAAVVYAGAIMFAPLTAACGATLGPCINGQEKLLSEDMKGQMLELSRQQSSPQLVPAIDLMARGRGATPVDAKVATAGGPVEGGRQEAGSTEKSLAADSRVATALEAASPGRPPNLVWGRYAWSPVLASDTLSLPVEQAMSGDREHVAGSGTYVLYRERTPGVTTLMATDANATFRLTGGTANFVRYFDLQTQPAQIDAGSLSMDFARATFATQLNVSNATIGADTVRASGTISPTGTLTATQTNSAFSGAVTLDGKEAGYLFERFYSAGVLRGITLWGR